MLKKTLQKAMNQQINAEFYSAYLYLGMSVYFETVNLPGFAHWTKEQAREEMAHGMRIFEYVIQRGGNVDLFPIASPPQTWHSPVAVFEEIYKHETDVSEKINMTMDLATQEKDHATKSFLQIFVDEQVEEEASANEILQKLKRIGGEGSGLFMLDGELGKRPSSAEKTPL